METRLGLYQPCFEPRVSFPSTHKARDPGTTLGKNKQRVLIRTLWPLQTLDVQTHYKPTETFQYTHLSSSHLSVEKGFIKRETLRLLRTNLANETFELRKLEFLTRLLERC